MLAVLVVGTVLLLTGIAMIVLPGPAIVFIPLGLAVLSLEFLWARRIKKWITSRVRRTIRRVSRTGQDSY